MSKPAARMFDLHVCPLVSGVVPHVGGPVMTASPNVLSVSMPQARITDTAVCAGPPDAIAKGSPTVHVNCLPAARMGDATMHGGAVVMGAPTVLIGEAGAPVTGGGGGGGGGRGKLGSVREVTRPDGSTVTMVGENIVIEGDAEFRNRVVDDLQRLADTPTGQGILDSIQDGDHTVTIVETAGGNECAYDDPDARFENADGTAGDGTDSTVRYNPDRTTIGDGSEAWMTRPSEVGLGHELIHAEQASQGRQHDGETDGIRNRERQAVGLPPYEGNAHTENNIRRDMGEPARTDY